MTEQKQLRELQNDIKIVGTLKEVNLEIGQNKKDPTKTQIIGDIVITQEDKVNNRVNEHVIKLFAFKSGKLFKGYETILRDFEAAEAAGITTRVIATGNINENMYFTDGNLKQFNQLRGLFINRIDEKMLLKDPTLNHDSAVAQLEILVNGVRPVTDKDGIETGEYNVYGYTVGYKNSVHNLHDVIVGEDLADVITEHYEPGATGKLTFAINNYVELEEAAEEPEFAPEDGGFGVQVDISSGPIKRYKRELRVIGGFPAYFDDKAYDEDEIKFIKQIYDLRVQETKNAVPDTPPQGAGFGTNAAPQQGFNADPFANPGMIPTISDDDLPF